MTKCVSRWKNIIVVDEDKKEICSFELDQSGKIKDEQRKHKKKVSSFMKEVSLKHDIKKKDGCYQFIPKKLNLKFTGNIEIFSLNNDEKINFNSDLEIQEQTTICKSSKSSFFDILKFDSDQDQQFDENDIDAYDNFQSFFGEF